MDAVTHDLLSIKVGGMSRHVQRRLSQLSEYGLKKNGYLCGSSVRNNDVNCFHYLDK
jgi:hypothetical protein